MYNIMSNIDYYSKYKKYKRKYILLQNGGNAKDVIENNIVPYFKKNSETMLKNLLDEHKDIKKFFKIIKDSSIDFNKPSDIEKFNTILNSNIDKVKDLMDDILDKVFSGVKLYTVKMAAKTAFLVLFKSSKETFILLVNDFIKQLSKIILSTPSLSSLIST